MKIRKPLIIHPFLFAVFPVSFLYAHNIREIQIFVTFIPITVVLIITALMFFLYRLILRDDQKTAILLSFTLIIFFSYGPVSSLIQGFRLSVGNFVIGPHKFFLITGGILFYLGAHFIVKTRNNLNSLTKIMNVVALSLILIHLVSVGIYEFNGRRAVFYNDRGRIQIHEIVKERILTKSIKLPNIYYIIVDGYGRADILSEVYGYDNGEFINYLKQKGFYIADKSKSNYQSTFPSLSSSLNLSYLDPADGFQLERHRNNKVFSYMKQLGYTTVFTSSLDGDIRMSNADFNIRLSWLDDFDYKIINLTPLPDILSILRLSFDSYSQHRERINHTFKTVADTVEWSAPVFIYAHILSPHPPFVFGPNGENVQPNRKYSTYDARDFFAERGTRDEYIKGYREQIQYINKRLIKLINHILSKKDDLSIIILQGDHGPKSMTDKSNPDKTYLKECYSILNAYYFPGNGNKVLYESITPVNTFRLVFNLYFGERYDLLEDRNYFYIFNKPPVIVDVTGKVDNGKSPKVNYSLQ